MSEVAEAGGLSRDEALENIKLVSTTSGVAAIVARFAAEGWLALDTEFVWRRTYRPILGVVQLAAHDGSSWVVDAAAVGDQLCGILADKRVVKVLHDARQDIALLLGGRGTVPRNIYDTQLAAGFIGLSPVVSLKQLLHELLGLELPKNETCTDWCRRPLTEAQLKYAINDVRYMGELYDGLQQRVAAGDREGWLREDLARYESASLYAEPPVEMAWQRLKVPRHTPESEWVLLTQLAQVREELARQWNMPRNWVVDDATLARIAQQRPQQAREVRLHHRLRPAQRRQVEVLLLEKVRAFVAAGGLEGRIAGPERQLPARVRREDVDAALAFLRQRSEASGVAAELYGSRSEVAAFIADPQAGGELSHGWRYDTAGRDLAAKLGILPL